MSSRGRTRLPTTCRTEHPMANDEIRQVDAPDPDTTSPIEDEVVLSSCEWNGETFPEWYRVCRNGRVYQCLNGRWRNTGNSC